MSELRSQVNFRLSPDCNISISVTHIISTPEEAEGAGGEDARMVTGYLKGYGEATEEAAAE